jgi:hypothetical protein
MTYITPPLETEPDDLAQEAFADLEARIPSWLPAPANLETLLIESLSQLAGELMDVASAVPDSIFRYFGETLLGLEQELPVQASGTTTWTAPDNLGYTIEAGTQIGGRLAGDELIAFEVQDEYTIDPGTTSLAAVPVRAIEPGEIGNGISGEAEVLDALDWPAAVVFEGATAGGDDGEEDDEYLDRLRELLTLLSPRPILPNDFAILAKRHPAVYRATSIDLLQAGAELDPAPGSSSGGAAPIPPASVTGVPRCVTVAVADEDGESIGKPARQEVADELDALREVNFLVYVIDPTYTTITVDFTAKAYPDYDPQTVIDAAVVAVEDYLDPATFGQPPYGDAASAEWLLDTKVRYLEVAEVLNRVEGLWYVATLTVNGGTADVALTGYAPLPRAGAITGAPA